MKSHFARTLATLSLWAAFHGGLIQAALDESTLKPLGMNVGDVNFFYTPYFANAAAQGGEWLEFEGFNFGTHIPHFAQAQFDENGCPKFLKPGKKLRLILYGLDTEYGTSRPATWPLRDGELAKGKVVVTWKGNADVRLSGATFLAGESNGAETGSIVNGRRVYLQTTPQGNNTLTVQEIVTPITEIKAWLPDPANPNTTTLEGQLFHPTFLSRIAELGDGLGFLRPMDWVKANASPQKSWGDRRLPSHVFQVGVLHPRDPTEPTDPAVISAGNRDTGVAFEHIVALCNAANKDLWITIPHLAVEDAPVGQDNFVTKLAKLIRFGSDGVEPFSSPQVNPAFPPLNPNLRVYVEYSNEIWSSGFNFPQGNWAERRATQQGISRAQFNARRFCEVWRTFEQVFGNEQTAGGNPQPRVIKVAATFTGNDTYTDEFLDEIKTFGATLSPVQEPDLISPTTYFGNDIQGFAIQRAQEQKGTSDPWFYTTANFDNDPTKGTDLRPVSEPPTSPYWTGSTIQSHLDELFREWTLRMLSGSSQTGNGPDATGVGGGFSDGLRDMALTKFSTRKPLVTYEGGPSLFVDAFDGGDDRDNGLTTFMELLNRQPEMAEVYRIHLNLAWSKGLRTHAPYVESGGWGKFGQWGHLESIRQPTESSPKWKFLLDWQTEVGGIRHIDDLQGTRPSFTTAAKLPTAIFGTAYSTTITTSGGEGSRTVELIGSVLSDGLTTNSSGGSFTISGTATSAGDNFLFLRVKDSDGDPAWRIFFFKTVGGPGIIVESNLEGTDRALNLPATANYVQQSGITSSGWNKGAGITAESGDDGLFFSQDMPAEEAASTLAKAITDNEFWTLTLTGSATTPLKLRRAEIRFSMLRQSFHAPRTFAVFTSIGGFSAANAVFTSLRMEDVGEREFVLKLPDTAAFENVTSAVQIRIYGFAGRFAGHAAALRAFKLTTASAEPPLLNPPSRALLAAGGTYQVSFHVPGAWRLTESMAFVTVSPTSGTGPGTVNVTVLPNNTKAARGGSIKLGTAEHTLTQAAAITPVISAPAVVPPLTVSGQFSLTIPTLNPPAVYSIKGTFPPGLKLDQATGIISGKPSTAGVFDFKIEASNAAGKAANTLSFSFNVSALDPALVGTYHGFVTRQQQVNGNLGARLELTTTKTGGVSGKIITGSVTLGFRGQLDADALDIDRPAFTVSIPRPKSTPIVLNLTLDRASNSLTGTLTEGGSNTAEVRGWRNAWTTANKTDALKGYYTFSIAQTDFDPTVLPEGEGYGSLTVPDNGVVTVAGKLSDGSGFTTSSFVGQAGQVLLYSPLYQNRGSFAGAIAITAGSIESIPGEIIPMWSKGPPLLNSTDRIYKQGFSAAEMRVLGGKYVQPAPGGLLMNLAPGSGNAALVFFAAGLQHAEGSAPDVAVTVSNASTKGTTNAASVPSPTSVQNNGKVTISLTSSTGLFTGKFTVPAVDGFPARTVSYQGMIVNISGNGSGRGYFQLPQNPSSPAEKLTQTPILSGQVEIRPVLLAP